MRLIRGFIILSIMMLTQSAWAQRGIVLTNEPDKFMDELRATYRTFNNPQADTLLYEFANVYDAQLSLAQRERVIALTQTMLKRNYQFTKQMAKFYQALTGAVTVKDLRGADLDKYLTVTEKVMAKYSSKQIDQYLNTTANLYSTPFIYKNKFNTLTANGGSFKIDWVEDSPAGDVGFDDPKSLRKEDKSTGKKEVAKDTDDSGDDSQSGGTEADWGSDSGWDEPKEAKGNLAKSPKKDIFAQQSYEVAPAYQPRREGAVIDFTQTDLMISTVYDSVSLQGTKGYLRLIDNVFVGEGGTFGWETAGLEPGEAFVTFDRYNFEIRTPKIKAETVKLTYAKYFQNPVSGKFEYIPEKVKDRSKLSFPRFRSYSPSLRYKEFAQGVGLIGGLSLYGQRMLTSAENYGLSFLEGSAGDTVKFNARSAEFVLGDTSVHADRASVTLFYGSDSITHPGVRLEYSTEAQMLDLYEEEGIFKDASFEDSYHGLEINADVVSWGIASDSISFSTLYTREDVPVTFTSKDYFRSHEYTRLSGIYKFHPLGVAYYYADKNRSTEFYAVELATAMKLNPLQVQGSMTMLSQEGYVDYDPVSGLVKLNEKGIHAVRSYRAQKDYDNILIKSYHTVGPNSVYHISENKFKIKGVEKFILSDSLNVFITPTNREIEIVEKRDLNFNGRLNAGAYQFDGEDFRFDYDSFYVDMSQIDSIDFFVAETDTAGKRTGRTTQLGNKLQDAAGVIYINKPRNKSGLKNFPEYPKFDLESSAFVYFNRPNILGGAYDTTLFFEVDPFTIDSLSSGDPSSISFGGTFKSGGIIPDIETTLGVMKDKSLGFDYKAPPDGFQLYGGTGKFFNDVKLDSRGLTGNGSISYLSTEVESDTFTFYLDTIRGHGKKYETKQQTIAGVSYPTATAQGYDMAWLPYADSMIIKNTGDPFEMYGGQAKHDGKLIVSSRGMFGAGDWENDVVSTSSEEYAFSDSSFVARHSTFKVKSDDPDKPAVQANDASLAYDYAQKKAVFGPEEAGAASIEFPYAQYKTSIPEGIWDFEANTVTMNKPAGVDIEDSYFYSTRAEQDSLVFNGTKGVYDISSKNLTVSGIPNIQVADALIIPENNTIVIQQDAYIEELHNARLVIDTLNGYHNLSDGNINIISRSKFTGDADYVFVNAMQDTFMINFESFELEDNPNEKKTRKNQIRSTVGRGSIYGDEPLVIAPKTLFKGDVVMYAYKPGLEYNGYIKFDLESRGDSENGISSDWFKYKTSGDFDNVVVMSDDILNENDEPLFTGLHIQKSSSFLYYTLVSDRITKDDDDVMVAFGEVSYNDEFNEFTVASTDKLYGKSFKGNTFVYNDSTGQIKFEGRFEFLHRNPDVQSLASGSGTVNVDTLNYKFNTLVALNFGVPKQAWAILAPAFAERVKRVNSDVANDDVVTLLYKLADAFDEKTARAYDKSSRMAYTPIISSVPDLARYIGLTDVNMRWSDEYRGWYSVGKIGVSNIYGYDINAKMKGYLEIRKMVKGEMINLYLQPSPDMWLFISYDNRKLTVMSSMSGFNSEINSRSKGEPKEGQSGMVAGTLGQKSAFITDFKINYLGMTEAQALKEEADMEAQAEESSSSGDDVFLDGGSDSDDPFADPPAQRERPSDLAPVDDPFMDQPAAAKETPADDPYLDRPPVSRGGGSSSDSNKDSESETSSKEEDDKSDKKGKKRKKDKGNDEPTEEAQKEKDEPIEDDPFLDAAPKKEVIAKDSADNQTEPAIDDPFLDASPKEETPVEEPVTEETEPVKDDPFLDSGDDSADEDSGQEEEGKKKKNKREREEPVTAPDEEAVSEDEEEKGKRKSRKEKKADAEEETTLEEANDQEAADEPIEDAGKEDEGKKKDKKEKDSDKEEETPTEPAPPATEPPKEDIYEDTGGF